MADMHLEIITAERVVYSEDVSVVVAPGIIGDLGVLPSHAALLTMLRPGQLRVVKDGEESYLAVSGGFLEVLGNRVTVLADTAEQADEIDVERAEAALKRAQERVASAPSDLDLTQALASMRRSQARLAAGRRRTPRRPRPGGSSQPPG